MGASVAGEGDRGGSQMGRFACLFLRPASESLCAEGTAIFPTGTRTVRAPLTPGTPLSISTHVILKHPGDSRKRHQLSCLVLEKPSFLKSLGGCIFHP